MRKEKKTKEKSKKTFNWYLKSILSSLKFSRSESLSGNCNHFIEICLIESTFVREKRKKLHVCAGAHITWQTCTLVCTIQIK